MKKAKPYILSILISVGVGLLSAFFTRNSMDIYSEIVTPPLSPPSVLFPIVWTVLFVLMGVSCALVYTDNKTGIRPSFSFVGDDLGCTISGGTLTSGDTVGIVTVCATFEGNEGYNEATRTITITITEKKTA